MTTKRRASAPRPAAGKGGSTSALDVVGLFAGIGGIELGLGRSGHRSRLLCEIDPAARAVLAARFPGVPLVSDVRELVGLPKCDLLTAGFPCQDLSQAGLTVGIRGKNSGLVGEVFRLVEDAATSPRWLMLENVPFMLQLDRGKAMTYLTRTLSRLGFAWAYRVIDTRSFGIPQRRQRVILLASRTHDPREVLFHGNCKEPIRSFDSALGCGFYWTEGMTGLGWAIDGVPPLKGGSTIGIPSPPAIWVPRTGFVGTPSISDAERLQGFPRGWTEPAISSGTRKGGRWKLVGNAVSVPVAEWVGKRLLEPVDYDHGDDPLLLDGQPWPTAAWGQNGCAYKTQLTAWPDTRPCPPILEFLSEGMTPLSARATAGFLTRADRGSLRFQEDFLNQLRAHLERMESGVAPQAVYCAG